MAARERCRGLLGFVYGEIWTRPGLGMKERRLITVGCVAFQDAVIPIDEMDELALYFAAYYGWPKAAHLNQVIGEQQQCVLEEWRAEAGTA